jgi:hypothetical protein
VKAQIKVVEELFHIHKAVTISDLVNQLQCSEVTARRRLADIGYFSSFTHNSRFYTIESVAQFDQHGIWHYKDIGFSSAGTLKQTITGLVDTSPHGMTVSQIAHIIKMKCYAPVNLFYKNGLFNRIKHEKKFIYLSINQDIFQKQLEYYKQPRDLKPHTAIQLLVEYINNPQATCNELAQILSKKHFMVTAEMIHSFFQKQGVKKTPKL